jgi:opacity protein-like surface antigen
METYPIVRPHALAWHVASGACLSLLIFADARADDGQLGLYVGGGVGYAKMDQFFNDPVSPTDFSDKHRTGWKLLVGIRPLSWFGFELDYKDFGSAHAGPSSDGLSPPDQIYGADGHIRAESLFAVGYLPLHLSWIDVFGKVGLSHARASDSYAGNFPNVFINCATTCVPLGQVSVSESAHDTGLAYGGGVQVHYGRLATRLEYEQLNWQFAGNPSMASFVVTWSF